MPNNNIAEAVQNMGPQGQEIIQMFKEIAKETSPQKKQLKFVKFMEFLKSKSPSGSVSGSKLDPNSDVRGGELNG